METALSIKNLRKVYKNGTEALKGIDLEVKKGDFFALLGPNGAGKSTAINIIVSLVNKTSGKIEVFSNDIDKDLEEAKSYIGIVPQEFNFNIFEKTFDILVQQAGYYGVPKKLAEERAEKYLKKLGIWEKRNHAAREISGGQKRRLMIARSLVHEPQLLILDEPTAGADIEVRKIIWDFMKELNKSGKTIILTTHYFEEAENLCRHVAIINKGRIIADMPMKSLLAKLDKESYIFDLKKPIKTFPQLPHHKITAIDDTTIEIETTKNENINLLFNYLNKNNIEVLSMKRKANKLERIFLELINNKK